MSDDQNKNQTNYPYLQDDEDMNDATVELSLKDVFNIKKQDTPKATTTSTPSSTSSQAASNLSTLDADTDADRTVTNSINTMEILEEVELLPLDDDDDGLSTSVLTDIDKITMLDDMADWSQPNASNQPATVPLSPIYQENVDESTMAFSVPEDLLDDLHDEDATLNASIPREWLHHLNQESSQPNEDATMALSREDIEAARALANQNIQNVDERSTSEMSAYERQQVQTQQQEQLVELEFVAAVDHNNRLFVPLRLFEEGKLKPGMRLLIRATVMK